MWKKWLMYGATVIVCGLLIQQVATTVYLSKIDYGLRSSLHSTKQLASIQSSIIQNNQSLKGMASTAADMDTKLTDTLTVTKAIDANIQTINRLNKATLDINQSLISIGGHSQDNLSTIANHLSDLNQQIGAIGSHLGDLNSTLQIDEQTLADMRVQTHTMNSKVPGVVR